MRERGIRPRTESSNGPEGGGDDRSAAVRIGLRTKLAASQAALVILLGVAASSVAGRIAEGHFRAELVARLASQCAVCRAALEEALPSWPPQAGAPLDEGVRRVALAAGGRLTLVDIDGTVLADSEGDRTAMENHAARPEIADAMRAGLGTSARRSATTEAETMYVAVCAEATGPVVRMAVPLASVRAAVGSIRTAIALATLVATLLAAMASVATLSALTATLGQLAVIARRLGAGDLAARARLASGDEVGALGAALDSMADDVGREIAAREQAAGRLERILEQMAEGVLVLGPDERVSLVNAEAARLLGRAPDDTLGRVLGDLLVRHEMLDLARRAVRLQTPLRDEISEASDSGRVLSVGASPLRGPDSELRGAVLTLRDVTELRRLATVRQEFVANASHELRTPVAAIQALAEALDSGALADPEQAARFVGRILDNSRRLTNLLTDMLALARLDAAPDEHEGPGDLSVRGLLEQVAARLEPLAEKKDLHVSVEVEGEPRVNAIEPLMMAALANLLDNAIKFTPEGGAIVLRGEADSDPSKARLSVTDTGPGIPEKARERIFERFYRVDRARSRELGGTGLGLSIVRNSVERCGGRVWVEASPKGGACFVVVLPAARADAGHNNSIAIP